MIKSFSNIYLKALLCLFFVVSFASANEEAQMQQALRLIGEGKWRESAPLLDNVSRKRWRTPTGEKAAALLVEAHLRLGQGQEVRKHANRFLDFHTNSPYRERVLIATALLDVEEGQFHRAMETLLRIQSWSRNPHALDRAQNLTMQILAGNALTSQELSDFIDRYSLNPLIMSWLHLQLGRELQIEGRFRGARFHYNRVMERSGGKGALAESAQQGLEALENRPTTALYILVLAPLSGDFAEFGTAMVQGILLAKEQLPRNTPKFELRIVDTRGDPTTAVRRAREAVHRDSVIGIIGPVMSAPAVAVASWLAFAAPHIPLITPTATDEGIARIGRNIFQLNVPTAHLARAIADHAMDCLGIREFGILSPATEYGRIMSETFAQRVEDRGGIMLGTESFIEGKPDYKIQFQNLRTRKYELDARRRRLARGAEDANLPESPRERNAWLEDSLIVFPGFFIPVADPSDAVLLARQAAFYKIGGRYLGSSGWYGRPTIAEGKRPVENAVFSAPFLETSGDSAWENFRKAFGERWNSYPGRDRVAGLSYDAMRLLVGAWLNTGEGNLPTRLLRQGRFDGVYGPLQIDPRSGANIHTPIITVQKGRFHPVENCQTPNSDN